MDLGPAAISSGWLKMILGELLVGAGKLICFKVQFV